LVRDSFADSAQPFSPSRLAALEAYLSAYRLRAFRNYDQGVSTGTLHHTHVIGHFGDIVWDLRDQDSVGLPGDTSVQRNPTCVPAHHFYYQNSAMGLRRCVQAIDASRCKGHRRREPEGRNRRPEIIVDCHGYTDNAQSFLVKLKGTCEAAVSSNSDMRVELVSFESIHHPAGLIDLPTAPIG
jgi:hypothetical protein